MIPAAPPHSLAIRTRIQLRASAACLQATRSPAITTDVLRARVAVVKAAEARGQAVVARGPGEAQADPEHRGARPDSVEVLAVRRQRHQAIRVVRWAFQA